MKKVLILGAGMVSKPIVRYLLDLGDIEVTQASRTVSKAEAIMDGHPNGRALELDVTKQGAEQRLEELVEQTDVAVSLLPYTYHVKVAELCIKHKKNMVTTSYVSDAMKALDGRAKQAGIVILNESGLDPGIDHMSAMKIIHDVERRGGKVTSFRSTTGALPSHESNNNPFGYKFSWSPRGVLLASRNSAKWLQDGNVVDVPGERLFENYKIEDVPGAGSFENYPNRNSVPYKEIYGLKDARTVYRGTFRMTGWCETLRAISGIGWLKEELPEGFSGNTYGDVTRSLLGAGVDEDLKEAVAKYVGVPAFAALVKRMEWLGLFSDEKLPEGKDNPLDYLNVLTLRKMNLQPGDKDMVVMNHEFIAEFPDKKEFITSTLIDYGILGGDTSVARTVALPAAIAVRMILNGKIAKPGVFIPVDPHIYEPILEELEGLGIKFVERVSPA